MIRGAKFSECQDYRYRLWREWDPTLPTIAFCMLNPSTATETVNDPTIERCQRQSVMLGYGRIEVINVFALRSNDPNKLYEHDDPVGPDNMLHIQEVASELIVCGWGASMARCEDRQHLCCRCSRNAFPARPMCFPSTVTAVRSIRSMCRTRLS